MPLECKQLVDSYIAWLRDKISIKEINGACEITTPFLDRHNDRLQIFIMPTESGMRLTDDGYILSDLKVSGCSIDTPNRRKALEIILNGFGVQETNGELYTNASASNFPQKKHALLQAMISINDMFMTARHHVATLFWEDVSHYLESHDVRFSPNVEFTGKTGFIHKFDFLIPKSRRYPERLLRAINHPKRDVTTSVLFSWTDTRDVRSTDSVFYVILNDSEKEINNDLRSAFEEYQVRVIPWSQRDQHIEELAA